MKPFTALPSARIKVRVLRAFYEDLLARGMAKRQAFVAVPAERDKLLHAIFGVFKHQQPFDTTKLWGLSREITALPLAFSIAKAA